MILIGASYSMKLDDKISYLWSRLGYNFPVAGPCHGFTIRWIEACLLGHLHQFVERKKLDVVRYKKTLSRVFLNHRNFKERFKTY